MTTDRFQSYLSISFFNSEGAGLILACHEQVQLLHSVKSLKIEMNTRKLWNEDIGEAVITAFVPLYEKGTYIYSVSRVFQPVTDLNSYDPLAGVHKQAAW